MSLKHEFKVEMTCEGCSGAVKRILTRMEGKGVDKFEVNLENQKVVIDSTLTSEELLEALKKTGKTTTYIGTV